ncbi:MAG: MarR family transcriptional regulator [Candidatus Nanopelagicales bacterium]
MTADVLQTARVATADPLSVLFDLYLADAAAGTLLAPVMAPSGMTATQYAEYSLLRTQGPMSVSQFAAAAHVPLTTASDTLRALESRGHAARTRDPHDGRAWLVSLTADGRAAHTRARKHFRAASARVREILGDDEPAVRRALQQLAAACTEAATT